MNYEEIAYKYLYIDLAIKNLERDLKLIHTGPFKIKEPYIMLVEKIISKAIQERKKIKQIMFKHNIRIHQIGKLHDIVIYEFYLNNKVNEVRLNKYVIKSRVKETILSLASTIELKQK